MSDEPDRVDELVASLRHMMPEDRLIAFLERAVERADIDAQDAFDLWQEDSGDDPDDDPDVPS